MRLSANLQRFTLVSGQQSQVVLCDQSSDDLLTCSQGGYKAPKCPGLRTDVFSSYDAASVGHRHSFAKAFQLNLALHT